jgi:predicted transcriptional regulator
MLDADAIAKSSLEEFAELYETVKGLVQDQSQLQMLVDAVNLKIDEMPPAFRVEKLSLRKESQAKQKNWRLDKKAKVAWAYKAAEEMNAEKFVFADLWQWFERVRKTLNIAYHEDLAATKSSLSAGVKMLLEKGVLHRDVPPNEDGKAMFAKSEYSLKPSFKKSKHPMKKEVGKFLDDARKLIHDPKASIPITAETADMIMDGDPEFPLMEDAAEDKKRRVGKKKGVNA